jgi:YceI-like domain
MKPIIFYVVATVFFTTTLSAQKIFTKNGAITFFSKSPLENIKAVNNQVACVLENATGTLQFSVLIKGFHFEKALMEEHFNETYLESDKFPKSTFKGTVADIGAINFTKDGSYIVAVTGNLTIHGVTKNVTANGNIVIKNLKPNISAKFIIKLADYDIKIPSLQKNNISETIEITVSCNLDGKI